MKKEDINDFFEKFNLKEKKKLNKAKIKQYSLAVIACMLFIVGFVNYNFEVKDEQNDEIAIVENENEDMIGDVELVSSGSIVENETTQGNVVANDEVQTNSEITQESLDYFETVRIDRDSMYARMLETYNKMIDNKNLSEEQKRIAVQEIEKITNNQNAIMIAENLIKNKGFEDAVVLANSDIINVIVKSSFLSNEDIGKIQNIVEREFKVSLENVNISNKN